MELFHSIPVDNGDETIRAALAATINRAREQRLATTGWSLAELALDESDAEWLGNWARTLDDATARRWLLSESAKDSSQANDLVPLPARRAAIGVLLLLLAAEQARRKTRREEDWLVAPVTTFNEPIRKLLFNQHQPTELHINTLMQASQRLRLRQNGGWTTPDSEHENIALQFGLTEADLHERWPQWLRGAPPPKHIVRLLDAETGSHSFQQLWQNCCDFLESFLSESELRAALASSPWVLPGWVDALVTALEPHRQRIAEIVRAEALLTQMPTPVVSNPISELGQTPSEGAPQTQSLQLETVPNTETHDIFDSLTPFSGVKTIIRATRALLGRADRLGLRGRAWSLAELCAGDCDYLWLRVWVKRLEVLTVWFGTETEHRFNIKCSADEESISYRAALGCLLLLWLSETARRNATTDELWASIHPDDFDQSVAAELFKNNQPSSFMRAALAAAVRELNLRHALDDGVRCWTDTVSLQYGCSLLELKSNLPVWLTALPNSRALRELLDEKAGSASFQFLWRSLQEYQRAEITEDTLRKAISESNWVLPEWADDVVRAARQTPTFSQDVEPTVPELPAGSLSALRLTSQGWRAMTGDEVLSIEEVVASRFKIAAPARRDERGEWVRWAVMEGCGLAKRLEDAELKLDSPKGLGAPLTLKAGPFDNPISDFCLAAAVIDRGIIEGVVTESLADGAARVLRLKITNRAEPSDQHFIVWWNENGEVGKLSPDYCDDAEDGWWWVCKLPDAVSRPIAVGIARGGLRVGAWWQEDWPAMLLPVMNHEPLMAAALMRWLRLPVLGKEALPVIRANSHKHAEEFLSAWLKGYGLPEWLRFESLGDPWLVAVRSIFQQWWPEPDVAARVLMTLANALTADDLNENLLPVSRLLCGVDPLLLVAVLKTAKEQVPLCSPTELRLLLAGCQMKSECDGRKQELLAVCAEEFGVEPGAIRAGLLDCALRWLGGYDLHPHEECNLAFAAQSENARQLVALHLLEKI